MKNLIAMFSPYYLFKDLVTIFIFVVLLMWIVSYLPNVFNDCENYVMGNPMQTPASIVPEWCKDVT